MKHVVTAAEMQSADQYTSEKLGLPSIVLMERAALAVADEICRRFAAVKERKQTKVCIACGSGNNGGDGFALGRILNERGFSVHFFMVKEEQRMSEANGMQRKILENLGLAVSTGQPIDEYDIIVDALFGTGLHREITGGYRELIGRLNEMKGYKVAVDIPSGIHADDGSVLGCAFQADLTVTFAFYKWGQLLYPGKEYCQEVICADIGIPETALCENPPFGRMLDAGDIPSRLPARKNDSHKGTYGKAGVIAGSKQMGGAAILCGKAAMKTGVGYTKIITEKSNREPLLSALPEALLYLYETDKDTRDFQIDLNTQENRNKQDSQSDLNTQENQNKQDNRNDCNDHQSGRYQLESLIDCNAVAIGPGIGTGKEAEELLEAVLEAYDCSLIVDADAINILAKRDDLKEKMKRYAKKAGEKGNAVVLTPHKKEFSRLTGISMGEVPSKWHQRALETAKEYGVILVLKDAATRIYTPEGMVYVNTTGNPGMSTAGSGDVLTGILCGLLTQMKDKTLAAVLGVYLHGRCGDYAEEEGNAYSMTATDMIDALNYVLKGAAKDETL